MWWPRFIRAAEWLVGEEEVLRANIERIFAETNGGIEFDVGERKFKLTARADRIDRREDGSIAIIDYKTGTLPGIRETFIGLMPQLPLEAAIAKEGGFNGIEKAERIADILVIALAGGHPPGTLRSYNPEEAPAQSKSVADALKLKSCDDLANAARVGVERMIKSYDSIETPYLSIPRPKWRGRFGQYDHLARIKEWSANEEGGE
jgi:ATP-dependent helicase/nuclease subunit B